MTIKNNQSGDSAELRRQAEAKLSERLSAEQAGKKKATALPATESDTRRLIHELEVHQIELEMQNEELLQSRAKVEAGLRQCTDLYDFAPVGYFTLARDGAIHQVNLAGANLLGVKHGALIKRRFGVFVSARSRTTFSAFLEKVFSTSGSKETCEVAFQKDGSDPLWVHIEAITKDGQSETCRAVVVDITERKRAEYVLREREKRLSSIYDTVGDGIFHLAVEAEEKYRFISINQAFCNITGLSQEQVVGKMVNEMIHEPSLTMVLGKYRQAIDENRIIRWEGTSDYPAGRLTGEVSIAPVVDDKGRCTNLVGSVHDITERKRAEQEIEVLARFPAENPNPVLRVERDGKINYANPASEALLRLWNCKVDEYLPPDWRERVVNAVRHNTCTIIDVECEERVYSVMVVPILDAGYVNLYGRDITERKRAEEELRQSEQKLRFHLQNTPMGIVEWDTDFIVTRWSGEAEKIFGWSSAETIGKPIMDLHLIYDEDIEIVQNVMKRLSDGVTRQVVSTNRNYTKNGKVIYCEWYNSVLLNSQGKMFSVMSQILNITERKRAEEELSESEMRYRSVLQSATDAIITADSGEIIIGWNSGAERIFGYSYTEAVGQSLASVIPLYHNDEHPNGMKRLKFGGDQDVIGKTVELEGLRKDKSVFPIELSLSTWETKSGQFITGIIRDITERKRAEEELSIANKELVFQNEEKEKRAAELIIANKALIFQNEEKEKRAAELVIANKELVFQNEERKRAEEELREALKFNEQIIFCAQQGIIFYDFDLRYLVWNPFMEQLTGFPASKVLGKHPWEVFPFLQKVGVIERLEKALVGEPTDKNDFPYQIQGSGKSGWASDSSAPFRNANGEIIGVIGIVNDITERKRDEETLKKSEQKLKELFENAPVGYHEIDAQGNISAVNQTELKMLGFSSNEMIGWPAWEFLSDREEGKTRVFGKLAGNLPSNKNSERSMVRRDGTSFPALIDDVILRNEQGEITGIRTTLLDITERKQAEEALKESQESYRKLFENHSAVKIILDPDTAAILDANDAAVQYYGWTREELKHMKIYQINTLSPEEVKVEMERVRSESRVHFEFRHRRADGSIRDVEVFSSKIEIKGKDVLHSIIHDITERKRAEEALQESELRFRSLYENATIGIYRTTPDGNILLANPALVKMLGYTSFEKLAERNLEKDGFEPSYQRKEFLEKIERDGEIIGNESKWTCQDGIAIFVLESTRAIRDSHGKTLYYDGTIEDITKRKLLEDQMRQMQKLEGLGTLAGGIAHDFNNILGIILGYNTSIKRFKDDPKKLDLATETITKAVDRGKTLVQQILLFARKTETAFGAVNVNDVVMETVTMVMETFPKFITCSQNFDKSISYINANRSQLHQVLMNLCVNARDAMPNGGVLSINTLLVSGASLLTQHPSAVEKSYVCIEVSDIGEGMTLETQKRIFEPFFTTKGIGKGTGLGLSVTFGVIQTHKGFIDVESELGKGTTFRIYLPASQVAEPIIKKEEETLESIPGGTETLLVVEDEEMLLVPLQMKLVEKGYNVLSAKDGLTALKIYQEKKSDIALVMTDLGLPDITGLEVCQQIKAINPNQHIILASGYIEPNMKSELLKVSIQHFLYKPYDLSKVLKEVREVLDEK